jgi:DNA-binding transcriptional ArsR family regulator
VKTYEEALNALGDPTRRRIFDRLAQGPKPVGELALGLPISRPAVSQHLRVLKDSGLVTERPEGTRRVYRVDPSGVIALRAYFEAFWDLALGNFQDEAEQAERSKR